MPTKPLRMPVTRRTFLQLVGAIPIVIAQLGSQRSVAGQQQIALQSGYGLDAYGRGAYPGTTSNGDPHSLLQASGATSNLYLPFVSKAH